MEDRIMVANLKMNLTGTEVSDYLKKVNGKIHNQKVIICPSTIYIPYFLKQDYEVGIQNICREKEGSYTGEVSAKQARSLGIHYAIVGHSERRICFNETSTEINQKIEQALKNHMHVILCIGESNMERENDEVIDILTKQLEEALIRIDRKEIGNIIIAYEPTWSIGSGQILSEKNIQIIIYFIKKWIEKNYGIEYIRVLYGGSVSEKNIHELNKIENIDGFLIGDASTDPEKFLKIIEVAVTV